MLLKDALWLVLDTETTGFDPKDDKVLQIGAVWLDKSLRVINTFESFVNPEGVKIPPDARAIHHIGPKDVEGAPLLPAVLKVIEARGTYNAICAHNAPFDMSFIKPPSSIPVMDTLRLAKKLWPGLLKHTNQFLRYHFDLTVEGAEGQMAHSALPDARVTAANLSYMIQFLRDRAVTKGNDPDAIDLDILLEWLAKPLFLGDVQCKFGKHKGKTWSEIAQADRSYLQWMIGPKGMSDMDIDQKYTVERLLGIRND